MASDSCHFCDWMPFALKLLSVDQCVHTLVSCPEVHECLSLPWGGDQAVDLASCHCCHDQHHPMLVCSGVAMVMTVDVQDVLWSPMFQTARGSEGEREERSCQTGYLLKGQAGRCAARSGAQRLSPHIEFQRGSSRGFSPGDQVQAAPAASVLLSPPSLLCSRSSLPSLLPPQSRTLGATFLGSAAPPFAVRPEPRSHEATLGGERGEEVGGNKSFRLKRK
ncbi:hypothetical protein Q8A73_002656 [Channa argus]|nr:hypothetical protein Q8A73_002656 [Channa argus]